MDSNEINRRVSKGESFILASDGQFLGKLCLNIYDPESILNNYGVYGSPYSAYSINNRYSMYGSQYSSLSPFNPYTITPPTIYLRGIKIGFLSVNQYLHGSISPLHIKEWMRFHELFN